MPTTLPKLGIRRLAVVWSLTALAAGYGLRQTVPAIVASSPVPYDWKIRRALPSGWTPTVNRHPGCAIGTGAPVGAMGARKNLQWVLSSNFREGWTWPVIGTFKVTKTLRTGRPFGGQAILAQSVSDERDSILLLIPTSAELGYSEGDTLTLGIDDRFFVVDEQKKGERVLLVAASPLPKQLGLACDRMADPDGKAAIAKVRRKLEEDQKKLKALRPDPYGLTPVSVDAAQEIGRLSAEIGDLQAWLLRNAPADQQIEHGRLERWIQAAARIIAKILES